MEQDLDGRTFPLPSVYHCFLTGAQLKLVSKKDKKEQKVEVLPSKSLLFFEEREELVVKSLAYLHQKKMKIQSLRENPLALKGLTSLHT